MNQPQPMEVGIASAGKVKCHTWGQFGHISRFCPNKAQAPQTNMQGNNQQQQAMMVSQEARTTDQVAATRPAGRRGLDVVEQRVQRPQRARTAYCTSGSAADARAHDVELTACTDRAQVSDKKNGCMRTGERRLDHRGALEHQSLCTQYSGRHHQTHRSINRRTNLPEKTVADNLAEKTAAPGVLPEGMVGAAVRLVKATGAAPQDKTLQGNSAPRTYRTMHITSYTQVEGKESNDTILDTGASILLVPRAFLMRNDLMGLTKKTNTSYGTVDGGSVQVRLTRARRERHGRRLQLRRRPVDKRRHRL